MRLRTRGRFNLKRLSRTLADRLRGSDFDRAVRRAAREGRHEFVFGWNRGLGDVALGLVPLFAQIRERCQGSRITVYTRADLLQVFQLTDVDRVLVVPDVVRGTPIDMDAAAAATGMAVPAGATVFADPDPTRWLDGRRQAYPPVLHWKPAWDALADRFVPAMRERTIVGAHVHSETAQHYGYVKDWPEGSWRDLLARYPEASGVQWLLFGHAPTTSFDQRNVLDLRGMTDFIELLAVIRGRCRVLIAPDSGILTAAYYLDARFPIDVVSLWSDPRQGVLKQGCPSPNPGLRHTPLVGAHEDVSNIAVDTVQRAVAAALDHTMAPAG
jgi:ADP-heptose:LPS heptosyltransferase